MYVYIYIYKLHTVSVCVVQWIHQISCMETISFVTCTQQYTQLPTPPMKGKLCGKFTREYHLLQECKSYSTKTSKHFRSNNSLPKIQFPFSRAPSSEMTTANQPWHQAWHLAPTLPPHPRSHLTEV